jgi:hypothetical protein
MKVITIDRSVPLQYPECIKKACSPELENVGPSTIDFSDPPELYLCSEQQKRKIRGYSIHTHLKETGLINRCMGLREAEALQKHPECFPEEWKRQRVCLWKGLAHYNDVYPGDEDIYVPYLCWWNIGPGQVLIGWDCLENYQFNCIFPAALCRE